MLIDCETVLTGLPEDKVYAIIARVEHLHNSSNSTPGEECHEGSHIDQVSGAAAMNRHSTVDHI